MLYNMQIAFWQSDISLVKKDRFYISLNMKTLNENISLLISEKENARLLAMQQATCGMS